MNPKLDYYNYKTVNNPKAREKIVEIMNTKYLVDPFREKFPTHKKYTWKKRNPCKQARLDFFLVSESLMQYVQNVNIDSSYRSELQFVINDQLFLDTLLMEIRGESISYASFKNKQRNNREKYLIKQIEELDNSIENNNIDQLEILKTELYDIRHDKLKGHMIRSKAQYIDQGEKPTKYFCGLEKHNYISKIIGQVEKEDGTIITNQTEILNEIERYYAKLYENKDDTLDEINLNEYMKDMEIIN